MCKKRKFIFYIVDGDFSYYYSKQNFFICNIDSICVYVEEVFFYLIKKEKLN